MSAIATDVFDGAMQALEAGFRVLHIATFDLRTCATGDDTEQILGAPELAGFDHIPVQQGSKDHRRPGTERGPRERTGRTQHAPN
jgi:hypothetical protein